MITILVKMVGQRSDYTMSIGTIVDVKQYFFNEELILWGCYLYYQLKVEVIWLYFNTLNDIFFAYFPNIQCNLSVLNLKRIRPGKNSLACWIQHNRLLFEIFLKELYLYIISFIINDIGWSYSLKVSFFHKTTESRSSCPFVIDGCIDYLYTLFMVNSLFLKYYEAYLALTIDIPLHLNMFALFAITPLQICVFAYLIHLNGASPHIFIP